MSNALSTSVQVAVIGGGPAGCSAAITLAQLGFEVALFEAKRYPHHKVCGEFLSPGCQLILDALGITPQLRMSNPIPINIARITLPNGATWDTSLPGTALGLSRYALDALMVERAKALGVAVHDSTTVTKVEGNLTNGFQLEVRNGQIASPVKLQCQLVIGAQGKRSNLDRVLKRSFLNTSQPFVALKAHFRGPAIPNRIELHAFPGGYCGMSEIENGLINVCMLISEPIFQKVTSGAAAKPEAFIGWIRQQNPYLDKWFSTAERTSEQWLSISQIPFSDKRTVINDVLMAGDAAGLITPLAGDGIEMALQGGQLAASYAARFLGGAITSPDTIIHDYTAAWKHEFSSRLKLARFLQFFMLRPAFLSAGLALVKAAPRLGAYFVTHTRIAHTRMIARQDHQVLKREIA